jgi:uncharacterized protein involved in exopolysaccharide biosynthesis
MFFILPIVVITGFSAVGAYLLSDKYVSSTTILVQREQMVNPFISNEVAAAIGSEDRLKTFNEILLSRTNLQKLLDSLDMISKISSEGDRQALVNVIGKNIETERRGTDAFSITYTDTDPVRAQKAVALLSKLFIETVTNFENQRSDQAVQFLEKKLEEIREKYEASQKLIVSQIGRSINSLPSESRGQYTLIENIDRQIADLDIKTKVYQQSFQTLETISQSYKIDELKEALYNISRTDIPFSQDLRSLLLKYDDYLRRFTPQYPDVQKIEQQISELVLRIHAALVGEIKNQQSQRWELEKRRAQLVDDIRESSISLQLNDEKEADYSLYRKLYDEIKVKLEQARTTRELGTKSANQFVIIDPPIVPTKPTKPNRPQLILGGFGLSLFVGFLAVVLRELFDTTIRSPKDIEIYQKPIVAYIFDGDDE